MDLSFQAADPAGNITLLVTTPVPPQDYPAVAARLLSIRELDAEQVGFLVPPQGEGALRLEMMGGEFCVNALRCAGFRGPCRSRSKPAPSWTPPPGRCACRGSSTR